MRPLGLNMSDVKQMNRSHVLWLLLTEGSMSRTDLANKLQLTTATLTSICSDFIKREILIDEGKEASTGIGRRRNLLSVNPQYKYIISVNIHYSGNIIVLTDLMGNPIASEKFDPNPGQDVLTFCNNLADRIILLLWREQIEKDCVLACGITILGPVNQDEGVALQPYHLFREETLPLKNIFEELLPFSVCVENNVCAFLNAEILFGTAKDTTHTMAIRWGAGVGSAYSINGIVCKGRNYQSAEIGHMHFYRDPGVKDLCRCGKIGCLETGVHLNRIIDKILALQPDLAELQEACKNYGNPNIDNIGMFLTTDCKELKEFVLSLVRDLAVGVNNALALFAADKVILFGNIYECRYVMEAFISEIRKINPSLPADLFQLSALAERKEFIGGVAIAVQKFLLDAGGE